MGDVPAGISGAKPLIPLSPPSYAIADNSYRSLRTERRDQCILISGESGAGKTEATKKILQYYAVTCPASQQVETVKDRLLQSNPVLEVIPVESWLWECSCSLPGELGTAG